ncbi:response regulator transcription factor [Candidatus Sumerlaeota bacterium]|nr:response regulator transcription factor [Candidatus Sumerlaeota bacterium]
MESRASGETAQRPARVLIIDDHPLVRAGLAQMLRIEPDLRICGEAEDAASGLSAIEEMKPDIVILDISLRGVSGLDLLKDLRARGIEVPILVLSMHEESLYAERVLRAGAKGYLMKQAAPETVLEAIRCVLGGEIYLSEEMKAKALRRYARGTSDCGVPSVNSLSDRELEVFTLIGRGQGTRQIAETLHLSIKTVEAHRERIKQKLDLTSATELLQHATIWFQSAQSP